jgi:hypothetical protein
MGTCYEQLSAAERKTIGRLHPAGQSGPAFAGMTSEQGATCRSPLFFAAAARFPPPVIAGLDPAIQLGPASVFAGKEVILIINV